MMKHPAKPDVIGWRSIPGIPGPTAIWSDHCVDCGRPVRRMTGLGRPGQIVWWHSAARPGPDDPRRQPHGPAHRQAISDGMRAANARRAARRNPHT